MKDIKAYSGNIIIDSIFSSDEKHRFVLRRKYSSSRNDLENKKLVFILINPSYADELLFDKTNRLASNIGVRDKYNEVVILNIFSLITKNKKLLSKNIQNANNNQNDYYINKEIKNADRIIIAWGWSEDYSERIKEVKLLIKNSNIDIDKIVSISCKDKNGKVYNPAHLSMYITDNPPNYSLNPFNI